MTENALELVAQPVAPANLFGASGPRDLINQASLTAQALADVIRVKKLYKNIGGKSHVFVEGWTLLGSMLGVFPVVVWTRPLEAGGWEARVEARTLAGQIVGAAEASCLRAERNWKDRDDFALRSMAQTRATSKALRMPLGFIVVLAGYNATPAEEMLSEDLTEPLRASIAAVQAKKAAAGRRPTLEEEAERMGGQVITRATRPKIEADRPDLGTKVHAQAIITDEQVSIISGDWSAPPLCQCKSPIGQFASESKAHYGRKYWQCQRANDRVLELEEREPKLTYAQIYADKGVRDHWRSWAEPWPRKAPEPKEGHN